MFQQIWPGEIFVQASLQWHSRLARRTYKSVQTNDKEMRRLGVRASPEARILQ